MENKKGTETQKMTREDFAVLWKTIHLKITDTYDVPPEILWVHGGKVQLNKYLLCCRKNCRG